MTILSGSSPDPSWPARLQVQQRKAAAASDSEGEQEESAGGSDEEGSEDVKPKGRGKAASSKPAASTDPKVKKLQSICRAAGIKITPNIYVKVQSAGRLRSSGGFCTLR